jgi:hypothetical protein
VRLYDWTTEGTSIGPLWLQVSTVGGQIIPVTNVCPTRGFVIPLSQLKRMSPAHERSTGRQA